MGSIAQVCSLSRPIRCNDCGVEEAAFPENVREYSNRLRVSFGQDRPVIKNDPQYENSPVSPLVQPTADTAKPVNSVIQGLRQV